jgi:hypothetical protein
MDENSRKNHRSKRARYTISYMIVIAIVSGVLSLVAMLVYNDYDLGRDLTIITISFAVLHLIFYPAKHQQK